MPLSPYGVLKGRLLEHRRATDAAQHFQLLLEAGGVRSRVAINVYSADRTSPSEVEYLIVEGFDHPLLPALQALSPGFTPLASRPGGLALDYIRANLFDPARMVPLPYDVPGPDNDLNEKFEFWVRLAEADPAAEVYAFGVRWQDRPHTTPPHSYFQPEPDNGIHDIHMNQGNTGQWTRDDGVWQDGAWMLHLPSRRLWVAVFIKFQSQPWHTDDQTGHALTGGVPVVPPRPGTPAPALRVIGAVVRPLAGQPETVTLLNTSPQSVDLAGWALADTQKRRRPLSGTVAAGATLAVGVSGTAGGFGLADGGGLITLLDPQGLKVHGVSYRRQQVQDAGWTVTF